MPTSTLGMFVCTEIRPAAIRLHSWNGRWKTHEQDFVSYIAQQASAMLHVGTRELHDILPVQL